MKNFGYGDEGKTRLIGCNLDKTSDVVALLGFLDELNSFIGFSRSLLNEKLKDVDENLKEIQNHIFLISSEIAGAKLEKKIEEKEVKWLEELIIKYENEVGEIHNFIYPTGSIQASSLHLARAICRNVERNAFLLKEKLRKEILSYLNRLSDVLFVFARVSNKRLNFKEEIWKL